MKRSRATLDDVADWHNLMDSFGKAARGKRGRPDVEAFRSYLDQELATLRDDILLGTIQPAPMRRFSIRDPKPRIIHAPRFRDRVLHHALINVMAPKLERALVHDTFACRPGKGALAAVRRAQKHLARAPWFAQIDIAGYFPSIDHAVLERLLARHFSDHGLLALCARIVAAHSDGPGRGLPIGTLTSQNFANAYLAPADRLITSVTDVHGYIRYMDDIVWWGDDRSAVRKVLNLFREFAEEQLNLRLKSPARIGRSRDGLSFCGYRIFHDRLLLSRRRRRRFHQGRMAAESAYVRGEIDAAELQRRMDPILAITAHADATVWRRAQIGRHPLAATVAGA